MKNQSQTVVLLVKLVILRIFTTLYHLISSFDFPG